MLLLCRVGGQTVDGEILGGATISETIVDTDFNPAHLPDLLDACELGLAVTQGTLRADLIVNVGVRANPADDLAGLVADGHGARQMPAIDAISTAQAELDVVNTALAQRRLPGSNRAIEILGRNDPAPAVALKCVRLGSCVFKDLMIEPVELAVGSGGPDMVRHCRGKRAKLLFAFAQGLLRAHPLGRLDNDGENAGRLTTFVQQGAVIEIEPHVFRAAGAIEDQMLVAEGQRFSSQADRHHPTIEVCDFRPAL